MNKRLVIAAIGLLVLLAACSQPQKPMVDTMETPIVPPTVVQTETVTQTVQTDDVVSDLEQTTVQVDELSKELDTSSLDELDKDLAEIEKLDFG